LITVEEAFYIVKRNFPQGRACEASLSDYVSEITEFPIIADRDYPPYHRVMMDGIAVSWESYKNGQRKFKIEGICAAGSRSKTLSAADSCLEVMTGSVLPNNTGLVIPYEDLEINLGIARVLFGEGRQEMQFVHRKGTDALAGDTLLRRGVVLNGPRWGIASSVGIDKIQVVPRPRVNIIATGDELIPVNADPQSHQIRISNSYALKASLQIHGYRDITVSHIKDDPEIIEQHYIENTKKFELLIYSGGVSKGQFDLLPSTWKKLGVRELFHGVAQRPGKPFWFGIDELNQTSVAGLPGNPVSSLVCLHKYFLSGNDAFAQLDEDVSFGKDLTYFLPVRVFSSREGILKATPSGGKNSGDFIALAESDGFLELPRGRSEFKRGEAFLYHGWR
jgi:molybdopterin molybdotransferase